jgi:hypothetical protein
MRDDIISLSELQKQVSKVFGIRLPQGSLDRILTRVKQRGYVSIKNHSYIRNQEKLATLNFSKVRTKVLMMHERLVDNLIRFCRDRYGISWTGVEAESALKAFLNENKFRLSRRGNDSTLIDGKGAPQSALFLVGSYIQNVNESGNGEKEYIETLAKGHMLANAIFLPEPAQVTKKFQATKVYFDTSFLIFVLGHAGEIRQESRLELVKLLTDTGAELRCFSHTLDELHGIFYAISQKIAEGQRHELYGAGADYILEKGFSASDIMLLATQAGKDLARIGIRVTERPEYVAEHVINESALAETLKPFYKNPQALQRDVDSVSATIRLREGRETPFLEDCRAIFVTTNSFLTSTVNDFFYLEAPIGTISPCLTDYALMNLLWLKQPLRAPDLPWKRVIADCYAATQPDEHLWNSYLAEIEKLEKGGQVGSDDYYMLRYSIEAKTALMDLTLGREDAFKEGTIKDILSRVRERLQESVKHELSQASRNAERSEEQLQALVEEANGIRKELERKGAADKRRREKVHEQAEAWSTALFKIIRPAVVFIFIMGGLYAFPVDLPPLKVATWRYLAAAVQWAIAALSLAGLIWGTALTGFLKKLEDKLSHAIERLLVSLIEA